jgi:hypothetical protein
MSHIGWCRPPRPCRTPNLGPFPNVRAFHVLMIPRLTDLRSKVTSALVTAEFAENRKERGRVRAPSILCGLCGP